MHVRVCSRTGSMVPDAPFLFHTGAYLVYGKAMSLTKMADFHASITKLPGHIRSLLWF